MDGLIFKESQSQTLADWALAQKAKEEVLRNAIRYGVAGLGVGAAGRGIQGLLNQFGRMLSTPRVARKPSIVDIPVPAAEEEEKVAQTVPDWITSPVQNTRDWLLGRKAKSVHDVPFGWIPSFVAGTAGVTGGWKGMDYLLDRAREREAKERERLARKEYEQTLLAQSKLGQAIHAELDQLYEKLSEDQREEVEKAADLAAGLSNIAGLWALLSGGLSGLWAYEATKSRQRSALLEKARKKYVRTRESMRPTPIYLRAAPLQAGSTMKSAPNEDELEGAPLDKAAQCGLVLAFAVR